MCFKTQKTSNAHILIITIKTLTHQKHHKTGKEIFNFYEFRTELILYSSQSNQNNFFRIALFQNKML